MQIRPPWDEACRSVSLHCITIRASSLRLRIFSRRSEFYWERSGCAEDVVCCPFLIVEAHSYSQAPRQVASQDRCVKAEDGAAVESASSTRSIAAINHTEGVGGWGKDLPLIPLSEFPGPDQVEGAEGDGCRGSGQANNIGYRVWQDRDSPRPQQHPVHPEPNRAAYPFRADGKDAASHVLVEAASQAG